MNIMVAQTLKVQLFQIWQPSFVVRKISQPIQPARSEKLYCSDRSELFRVQTEEFPCEGFVYSWGIGFYACPTLQVPVTPVN